MGSRLHKASNRLYHTLVDPFGKLRYSNPIEAVAALENEYQLCCIDHEIGEAAALSALSENYVIAMYSQQGRPE